MSKRLIDWQAARLSDVLSVKHGYAFKGEHIGDRGDNILVTPGNFHDSGGFKHNGDKQKRYDGAVPPEYVLNAGSVVVAMTEQAEGLLGSSAIIPADGVYLHNQRIGLIESTACDQRYLYHLFNTKPVRQQIRATCSGTKVRHTSPSRIGEVKFLLPPLPVQQRIGAILSAYDDLIEVNQRRIAILEEMARRLFEEWFVRFRYPGHETVPLIESDLGPIPEGWEHSTVGDWTSDIRDSVSPSALDPQTRYVGLEHLPRRSTTLIESGLASEVTSTKHRFRAGDILFGKIRPYFHKVSFMPFDGVCSSDAIVVRAKAVANSPFVLGLLSSDAFVAHAVTTSNGTKMPRADWKVLKRYPVLRPPVNILGSYNKLVGSMLKQSAIYADQNTRLRAARDLLLPKLISGEIEVGAAEAALAEAAE